MAKAKGRAKRRAVRRAKAKSRQEKGKVPSLVQKAKGKTSTSLQKKIKELDADANSDFDQLVRAMRKAQDEIYTLMARDNFPRFTKSQPFEDLLEEIGSYSETAATLVSDNDLTMLVQDGEGAGGDDGEGSFKDETFKKPNLAA